MSIAGRFGWRWYAGAAAAALGAAPLGTSGTPQLPPVRAAEATVRIVDPDASAAIAGNVAVVKIETTGVRIAPPDPGAPGAGVHFHVFVDRDPVGVGETIPREHGVIHSASNPVVVPGLGQGVHRLTVVLGDGAHVRVGDAMDSMTVVVGGPSLVAQAAATSTEGDPWTISVSVAGVRLVRPDGDTTGRKGHLEYVIDGPLPPAGAPISEDAENVVHTELTSVPITGLEAGEHSVWIVLADGTHRPFQPYVADLVTVTVRKP